MKNWQGEGLQVLNEFLSRASRVILDKPDQFHLALVCFLAQGHLLIEDIPGMGKTTFAKTLRSLLGLSWARIQFTNDLLPADIVGSSVYRPSLESFEFHPGPIFAEFVLADELNRATPRTQSALLQAMEERQVSVDRQTHSLAHPFFLVATQNPHSQLGTYPLPESQLDRFLMRIELGYPDPVAESQIIRGSQERVLPSELSPLFKKEELQILFEKVQKIHLSQELGEGIQKILSKSRQSRQPPSVKLRGLSPRAGIFLAQASRAAAFLAGRDFVMPEDLKKIAIAVLNHRLSGMNSSESSFEHGQALAFDLVNSVEII